MTTDWTDWAPIPGDLPKLDAETLAAVRALQGGEVDRGTRHLFEIFEPQLGAYFRRHGRQDYEADDLTQTVFMRMLERIGKLKDPASFHFWLFKIARTTLLNYVRDAARDRKGLEGFADKARGDSESGTFWVRGTFEPSPEARLTVNEAVDRRRVVLRKLFKTSRLKPRTLRSLLLRLRGASHQEIAHALGISAGTVGSHISRASAALLRNLERLDLDAVALDDGDAALVAELTPELLTFQREALEADPAYFSAGVLEAASADYEVTLESRAKAPLLLYAAEGKDRKEKVERKVSSPAEIAAVVRQDRRRGRPRRRVTRTIRPAGKRSGEPVLGPLSKADLGYPLSLLEEAVASHGERGGRSGDQAFDPLALKAKLTCVHSLFARGRRFAIARRAGEIVRRAIVLIGQGRRDEVRRKVTEARSLLESYLGYGDSGRAEQKAAA